VAACTSHLCLALEFSEHSVRTIDWVDLKIAEAQSVDPRHESFHALCDFHDAPRYAREAGG